MQDNGITPSQTVGPFFKYGLTPTGDYAWNDAFTNSTLTPDVTGDRIRIDLSDMQWLQRRPFGRGRQHGTVSREIQLVNLGAVAVPVLVDGSWDQHADPSHSDLRPDRMDDGRPA